MLGLYEFNQLKFKEQLPIVWNEADFIINYLEKGRAFQLYGYNDFYIEVIYNQKGDEITELSTFKKGKRLEPYLELIEIKL